MNTGTWAVDWQPGDVAVTTTHENAGGLGPLYAHLFSATNWVPFTELVVAQLNARQ